jgi:N-acetylglucosaminyl-diphospho-decaprenol L-rhamnosyltransferase
MAPLGSTIIVNYNSGPFLARCVESIAAHEPGARVIVVDNASTDGSERLAETGAIRITLVQNAANLGFARAVNLGVRRTTGEWVMLLNPDCQLTAAALARLVQELGEHPDCAIAGPRIEDEDGTVQGSARGDPTLLTGFFGRTGLLNRLFPRSAIARRNVRLDLAGTNGSSAEVDWVSGACMMVRRKDWDAVGGFDERYFMYWEDADLCRRLRTRGSTIRYVPEARVIHRVGGSSRTARSLAVRAFHRSAYTYYTSHVARNRLHRALAWTILQTRCRWMLFRDSFLKP